MRNTTDEKILAAILSRCVHERDEARAEVAALRERLATAETFIRAVADTPGRLGCSFGCNINERWHEAYPERHGQHGPTCKVTKARAWLARLASGDGEGA